MGEWEAVRILSTCIQGLLGGQYYLHVYRGCLVAKWLKRWTTDPEVPGSSPTQIATRIFFT